MSFKLPETIKKLLEDLSTPLDFEIKKKRKQETTENDYLLVCSRIEFILERIHDLLSNKKRDAKEDGKNFKFLMELLMMLFSNVILVFYIASTSWVDSHEVSKEQDEKLGELLYDLDILGKKFFSRHAKKGKDNGQ